MQDDRNKLLSSKRWKFAAVKSTKKQDTMKKNVSIVAAVLLLCACTGGDREGSRERSVYLTRPVALSEETVKYYSGIVKEAHEISLGFKTAGQIARIHVSEGDRVHRGQLLAELDDADYRLAVEALQVQYDQVRDEVKRTERLLAQKSVSANDYEKASAGLKQLEVQLQANKNKLSYTKLYAPTDGYIQAVNFSPAEMVDAGTALFTLLDVSQMEVSADIPGSVYRQREEFERFFCRASGIDGDMPLTLMSLTPKADGNQLYRLQLAFEGRPDRNLTAGRNVEVGIVLGDSASARGFAVPLQSLFEEDDSSCVWVFGPDSTVTRRRVVLDGVDADGRAVVIDGLTGNEQLVRAGVHMLQEGDKVRVIEAPSNTNVGGLL